MSNFGNKGRFNYSYLIIVRFPVLQILINFLISPIFLKIYSFVISWNFVML